MATTITYQGTKVELSSTVRVLDDDGKYVDGTVSDLRENDPLNPLGCIDVELPSGKLISVVTD